MAFVRAQRKRAFLKIAITGPTGSGKTYSALRLAFGLSPKVAVLDTENMSASLYEDKFPPYDVDEITPPYTMKKYVDSVDAAVKGGYEVLVIDSLSHAWSKEGGLLDQKAMMDAKNNQGFANWQQAGKMQNMMIDALLYAPLHVIVTMRSKMEHVQEKDERGKQVVRKVGMGLDQRNDVEYEFTLVLDVEHNTHAATTTKDRTGLFTDATGQITEDYGKRLLDWLNRAPSEKELAYARTLAQKIDLPVPDFAGYSREEVAAWVKEHRPQAEDAKAKDPVAA